MVTHGQYILSYSIPRAASQLRGLVLRLENKKATTTLDELLVRLTIVFDMCQQLFYRHAEIVA